MSITPLTAAPPTRRDWAALAVLTVAVMLIAIDTTVLSLAIPSLSADLAPSASELLWIGDIYSFTLAGLLVTMGNVADRIGRRRLLLVGSLGFGLSSVIAAFSTSAAMLIAARALLGVSGATIMPSTLSLIRNIFPDAGHRARAIAIWAAGTSAGTAIGPLVGGVLLDHLWWGNVFLINVPVMVVVLVGGLALLPESRNADGGPVDLLSSALSIGAIVPVVYAVKSVAHGDAGPIAVATFAVGLLLGWAFVRRQRTLDTPLLDVALFRLPAFTWAVICSVLAVFALSGLLYFYSQYLQLVRGYSTTKAGLGELPIAVASTAVVVLIAWLLRRLGEGRALAVGMVLMSAGLVALAAAESASTYLWIGLALAIMGLGMGIASTLSSNVVLGSVPANRAGAASAISETGIELGAALGIAVLGSVQDAGFRSRMSGVLDGAAGLPQEVTDAARQSLSTLASVVDPADGAQAALLAQARHAFTSAMQVTSLIAAAILLVAAVMAWRRIPSPTGEAAAATTGEKH